MFLFPDVNQDKSIQLNKIRHIIGCKISSVLSLTAYYT